MSSSISAATGLSLASVYRIAAGGRPWMLPKLPWPVTSRCRMFHHWAMRAKVG
jgi:hypothetical protein